MPPLRTENNSYTFRRENQENLLSIHFGQLQLYIVYDKALRLGDLGHPEPLGYAEFAAHFNADENGRDGTIQFALLTDDGRACVASPIAPTLRDVLGDQEARLRRQNERDRDGYVWYSKERIEIMDELLWEQAARAQREKKARDRAIRERKERRNMKRALLEEPFRSPSPRPNSYSHHGPRSRCHPATSGAGRERSPIPACVGTSVEGAVPYLPAGPSVRATVLTPARSATISALTRSRPGQAVP